MRPANATTPEGLESLPQSYADLPRPIKLGPPLPGDLGGAVLGAERELGVAPTSDPPFRPNPEDDAARAERIRQARLTSQALESGVFFQLSAQMTRTANAPAAIGGASPSRNPVDQNPFDGLRTAETDRGLGLDLQNDQNLQGRKLDFVGQGVDAATNNADVLHDPASPYQVMAGTIIPASLVTGVNSDLPGRVIAQVTEGVYDTASGRFLLIPQGARVIGTYDSVVAFGQSRALIVWNRIIMPDGSSVVIDNLPGVDVAGSSGLKDEVDFHGWRLLKGIALSTLLGVGAELTFGDNESDLAKAIREGAQDSANRVGQRIAERNLNIQPTITIRPGWPLGIIVNKDLTLRPYRG
ncbi:MAG TPA: TrbI/VirB10 family protein [Parvularculaceae bacterium]|nr:TrbI/VirB10 family protein [Parvularculaceae bacterium]